MSRRGRPGDMDRWVAEVAYKKKDPRAHELIERGRKKDRKADQRKGAQARALRQKRGQG